MDNTLPYLNVRLERIASVYVGDSWHDRDYRDGFTRFYYILGGEGTIRHSGRTFDLKPGRIYLIPEYTRHDYSHKGDMQMFYFHCQIRTPGGVSFFDLYDCEYVINAREKGVGFEDFERLRELSGQEDSASLLDISSRILRLIIPFVGRRREQSLGARRERDMARLMGVFNFIEEHLAEDPPVSQLAALINMERSAFTRLFSSAMGVPPGRYVQKKRIEKARALLDRGGVSCEEAGEAMGFYDASHFSRIFQRETGIRPGEYVERNRDGGEGFR